MTVLYRILCVGGWALRWQLRRSSVHLKWLFFLADHESSLLIVKLNESIRDCIENSGLWLAAEGYGFRKLESVLGWWHSFGGGGGVWYVWLKVKVISLQELSDETFFFFAGLGFKCCPKVTWFLSLIKIFIRILSASNHECWSDYTLTVVNIRIFYVYWNQVILARLHRVHPA
jgi:hypothetical protein